MKYAMYIEKEGTHDYPKGYLYEFCRCDTVHEDNRKGWQEADIDQLIAAQDKSAKVWAEFEELKEKEERLRQEAIERHNA